jgi:hypothetical protein
MIISKDKAYTSWLEALEKRVQVTNKSSSQSKLCYWIVLALAIIC